MCLLTLLYYSILAHCTPALCAVTRQENRWARVEEKNSFVGNINIVIIRTGLRNNV